MVHKAERQVRQMIIKFLQIYCGSAVTAIGQRRTNRYSILTERLYDLK